MIFFFAGSVLILLLLLFLLLFFSKHWNMVVFMHLRLQYVVLIISLFEQCFIKIRVMRFDNNFARLLFIYWLFCLSWWCWFHCDWERMRWACSCDWNWCKRWWSINIAACKLRDLQLLEQTYLDTVLQKRIVSITQTKWI